MGQKPSPFAYLKKGAQQLGKEWRSGKGETMGVKKPSPFPHSMRMGYDGMHPDRWDTPCLTEWPLVRQDMAWV